MEKNKNEFFGSLWEESWIYIKTVVDVMREPILILDKDFRVKAANESFYRTFQVVPKDTEKKIVYELGSGQWNIPALRKLLEDILPRNTFFNGFEVTHNFPFVGPKTIILNARQIHFKEDTVSKPFPPIILLAMEDVTEMMLVAETLAGHTNNMEIKLAERTKKIETQIKELERDVDRLKKSVTSRK